MNSHLREGFHEGHVRGHEEGLSEGKLSALSEVKECLRAWSHERPIPREGLESLLDRLINREQTHRVERGL